MRDEVNTFVSPADLVVDEVAALEGFRIWVSLSNGVAGELDLAAIAKSPWFQRWQDRSLFESVWKTAGGRNIVWGDDPEESDLVFCVSWLYVELTGQPWEEFEAEAKAQLINA